MAKGRVHTINLAAPPEVLTVDPGDTVRVTTEFDYVGPALSARMISAIWHPTLLDPHDEIVRGNKSFPIPSSPPPGNHITVTMDLLVPPGEVGTDYGLYSSIRDVPGPDIYTGYYPNIITITEVVPEFKGTISKKELEYNETQKTIPVSNVPQDKEGKAHIWGRNDMATNQKLGIHWTVRDPNGIVVEDYEDWESWPNTDPGKTHEFISPGRFDLNKPGTWTIGISLAMNPDSPVEVANYAGALCTVAAAPTTYHLSIFVPTWAAGGYVEPGSGDYPANTTLKLTAHPLSGYKFTGWGRDASGTDPTYDLLMDADKNVEAYFEKVAVEYTLEITVEPPATGYVTKSPSKAKYPAGEVVTLTAYPYSGYEFDHWGGWPPYPGVGSTSRTLELTMTADWVVVAAFQKEEAPPPECTPGAEKCVGSDLYSCSAEGRWVLAEKNAPQCAPPPPECTPGAEKCVGSDLYVCRGHKDPRTGEEWADWVLKERDSPQCQ